MQTPTDYPCPSWCQVSDWLPGHREDEWSEDDTHAVRPHSTAVFGKREMGLPIAQGIQGYTVDIGADEVAPMLAQGRRGPSLFEEPLIGLYAWVLGESGVDGESRLDLTADQARELAGSLASAADRLDVINAR